MQGNLSDGQSIAAKRLSTNSGQGLEEFKSEIKLLANLQHTNLVKLLGCCIDGEEKILIYEYMANQSLDKFIFGRFILEPFSRTSLLPALTFCGRWWSTFRSKKESGAGLAEARQHNRRHSPGSSLLAPVLEGEGHPQRSQSEQHPP